MQTYKAILQDLESQGRYRSLQKTSGIDLTSNDYLGLAGHSALRQAANDALDSGMDLGSGGSRLLRGNHDAHAALEDYAARYFGCEAVLFFATGFQANYALFTALLSRTDIVIMDQLIHASARDGIQASNARRVKVAHNDLDAFEDALKKSKGKSGQIWIAVESIYSMDGDIAPIKDLLVLAEQYDAMLVVDEAHASGIWGEHGKGFTGGIKHDRLISMHTCGKALGVAGGLICASQDVVDMLINKARAFIYSTAPMPLQAVLVKRALELIQEEPQRRESLRVICQHAQSLWGGAGTQIIPIILGEDHVAVEAAQHLQENGFDIRAIRPPTVPEGTSRLRVSLNTNITKEQLNQVYKHIQTFQDKKKVA